MSDALSGDQPEQPAELLGRDKMPNDVDINREELRTAPRISLLIRPAKLVQSDGEFLCVVRDVSEAGISVRLFHELPLEKHLAIECQNGQRYEVEVVWRREDTVGFKFKGPFDLSKAIAGAGSYPKRPLRLNLELPIIVSAGDTRSNATLHNLSNQGARIGYAPRRLAIGELIQLQVTGLPVVRARICWRRDETYGVVFVDTFTLSELARYAAAAQLSAQSLRGCRVMNE